MPTGITYHFTIISNWQICVMLDMYIILKCELFLTTTHSHI